MKKYSVLTFIIGKGYEKVHEIENMQDDVEYLLVTDDPDLKSNTWKVTYDEDLLSFKTPFERCFRVRYNIFKYCTTDICITIDGSMQVKGSLDNLIATFDGGDYDICLMPHPLWSDLLTEYNAWIRMRGYPVQQAQRAIDFFKRCNYDLSTNGLYQLCFTIKRRSHVTKQLDDMTLACLQLLSDESTFERLDQTVFSFVFNRHFSHLKVLPVSEQVVRSYAIQWFWHNSDKENQNVFYDIRKPDMKYVLGKLVECMYLK